MNINFAHRKFQLQQARKFDDIFQWNEYIMKAYPEWWESIYGNKWPIRIIYYNNDNTNTFFHFYVNRFETMNSIMNKLHSLLRAQFNAVCSCFGHDIAMNIYDYMSDLFDPKNNFFYYHSRALNHKDPYFTKIDRICLNSDTTLNQLSCALRNDPVISRYTNIRMRATPIKKPLKCL